MKVTFGKEGTATVSEKPVAHTIDIPQPAYPVTPTDVPAPPEAGSTAVATYTPPPPPAVSNKAPVVLDDDRISLSELKIPTVNIVQGVGDLNKKFLPGAIVFDKTTLLTDTPPRGGQPPQKPVRIVVIGFRPTRYAEKLPGNEQGRLLNSLEEVAAVGGSTVWREAHQRDPDTKKVVQVKPYFQPLASALVLVKAPEGLPELTVKNSFPLIAGGVVDGKAVTHHFAIAFWHLRGTSHTSMARPLKTNRTLGVLRTPIGYKGNWIDVTTELTPFDGGNSAFVPKPVIAEETPPEVRQLAQDALDAMLKAD